MREGKDQFYFQGKYFDNQDDLWMDVEEWKTFLLDEKTAERQLDTLKKEIIFNIFFRDLKLTNAEFVSLVKKVFFHAMRELNEITLPTPHEDQQPP